MRLPGSERVRFVSFSPKAADPQNQLRHRDLNIRKTRPEFGCLIFESQIPTSSQ